MLEVEARLMLTIRDTENIDTARQARKDLVFFLTDGKLSTDLCDTIDDLVNEASCMGVQNINTSLHIGIDNLLG